MSEEKVNDNIDGDPMSPYYTNKLNPIDDGEFDNIIKLQKEQGDMFPFGEILNLTGISSPYEIPESPNLIVNTSEITNDAAIDKIVNLVMEKLKQND